MQSGKWEDLLEDYESLGIECVRLKAENNALERELRACRERQQEMRTLLEAKERVIIALQSGRDT